MRNRFDLRGKTSIQYITNRPPIPFLRWHGPVLLTLCVAIAVAYPEWAMHSHYDVGDLGRLNVPQRMLLGWFYHHFWLPLWNPFSFGGQPFLEAGQAGPLYLPNVVFGALPIGPALKLSNLLHEWFAALTMYGLIWSVERNRLSGFVAGFVYVTSAIWVGHIVHTQMIDALAWLPCIVWGTYACLRRPSISAFLGLSAAFAMEIYAGHPQISWFAFITVAIFMVVSLLQRHTDHKFRSVFISASSIVLALLLASAQWLPTLELVKHSTRNHVSSAFLLDGYLPKNGLLQFLSPFTPGGGYTGVPYSVKTFVDLYGNPYYWELFTYAGLIALAIATATAVFKFKSDYLIRSLTVLTLVSVLLSLAKLPVVEQILLHVPGFDFFRVSARYAGLTDFSIAALTGIGIGRLNVSTQTSDGERTNIRWFIAGAASIYAVILIVARWHGPLHMSPAAAVWVPVAALATVAAVCMFPVDQSDRVWTLVILIVLDGLTATIPFVRLNMTKTAPYLSPSPAIQYVRDHLQGTYPFMRVAAIDNNENDDNSLAQDKSLAYLIPALNGYDSLEPSWYKQSFNLTWTDATLRPKAQQKLDAMDVRYAVTLSTYHPAYLDSWKKVYANKEETVYENPDSLSVWHLVENGSHASSPMHSTLESFAADKQSWSLDASHAGQAILSQTYDPGWHATVDNKPVLLSMTKLGLTSIRVPAGVHKVSLWYNPTGFFVGAILSVLSGLGWLTVLVFSVLRRRKP